MPVRDGEKMPVYQVIVIGAGPAGAMTAYHTARAGMDVVLLEKKVPPRPKPCGGGVTPKAARLMPFSWEGVIERKIRRATFTYDHSLSLEWEDPICFMVDRSLLDRCIVDEARTAGAIIRSGEEVIGVDEALQEVTVHTPGKAYRGRFVIGADGAHSLIARLWKRPQLRGFAAVCEIAAGDALAARSEYLEVDFAAIPGGYGWVFPKGSHLNVGVGSFLPGVRPLQAFLRAYVSRLGLADLPVLREQCFPIPFESLGGGPVARGRVILVGDAAGFADPCTGEGIFHACLSGYLAAQALQQGGGRADDVVRRYQAAVEREILPEMRLARRTAKVFYGLNHCAITYLMQRPGLLKKLWEQMYTGTYREMWRQVKRHVWRSIWNPRNGEKMSTTPQSC